jgi:hypothetical protein
VDGGRLFRDILFSIAVDPRVGPGSPRAKGRNPPRGEDSLAPRFVGLLRALGFSLVMALDRCAAVGTVRRLFESRRTASDVIARNFVNGDGSSLTHNGAHFAAQDFEYRLNAQLAECG